MRPPVWWLGDQPAGSLGGLVGLLLFALMCVVLMALLYESPGGNQVDGLPLAQHGLLLAPILCLSWFVNFFVLMCGLDIFCCLFVFVCVAYLCLHVHRV